MSELTEIRFMTAREVATLMRTSKMTVYRLIHSGELDAMQIGRAYRVPESSVITYLSEAYVHERA